MTFRFVSLWAAAIALVSAAFAQSQTVVITGADIVVGNGRVIPNGTLVIRDGKIQSVGPTASVPEGAKTFSLSGATLYPGFIDGCTTDGLKLPDAPSMGTPPDTRTTAPPTMWHANRKGIRADVLAYKCLDPKLGVKDQLSQGITTAFISPSSGSMRGVGTIVDYAAPASVLLPEAGVGLALRGGGGGPGGGGYPGTLFGVIALLRQVLADGEFACGQAQPPKEIADLTNLRPLYARAIPAVFFADTSRDISRASRVSDEFALRLVVAGGKEAYKAIDLLKAEHASVLASLDIGDEPEVKASDKLDAIPIEVQKERHDIWAEHSKNIKALIDSGIPLGVSSLGLASNEYLKNVRRVMATGVAPADMLRAMTIGVAQVFGIDSSVGTLEVGKVANIVVMSGKLEDPKSQISLVFVEGRQVDLTRGVK